MKIFGIRHHGPGSARSLVQALNTYQPDILLVEGPPDANDLIPLLANRAMQPPIAVLIYAPDQLDQAAYYPFAIFSPEWQAIQYGTQANVPVSFMDLPQTHQMALRAKEDIPVGWVDDRKPNDTDQPSENTDQASNDTDQSSEDTDQASNDTDQSSEDTDRASNDTDQTQSLPLDPLAWLAEAAGYTDSERWWEHMVEQRQDSAELFEAILEAITTLRQEVETTHPPNLDHPKDLREARREAFMRRTIRQAKKEGFERIAIVCGAWHGPALCEPFPTQKHDNALLKGLPKLKVKATCIPWTYGRLSNSSGYGAGIESPGWYDHLWHSTSVSLLSKGGLRGGKPAPNTNQTDKVSYTSIRWMTRVARLLRKEDIDASSASVIEAVRLAETLAALRDATMPGLEEMNEAAQTVLCFGDSAPMQLIYNQLIVSDRIGQVPPDMPLIPLQQDLQRLQKRLRLKPAANEALLTLDLRKPNDLERSHLFHRLGLLKINWGIPQKTSGKGTFKEAWELRWHPELSLAVIEAGRWGNTVETAAAAYTIHQSDTAKELPTLTQLLDRVLLATLPGAIAHLLKRLQAVAVVANDITHLINALPSLVNCIRYRDVRQTDAAVVTQVVDGLITRICIGLPGACASLDDDAAVTMLKAIDQTHSAIRLLQNDQHEQSWATVLQQLCDSDRLHGLIAGRCCRLLLDQSTIPTDDAARRLGLALSLANEPTQAAAWVEGFLQGSGLLLLHDDAIWQVLDNWITGLSPERFTLLLPLIRRTFASFPAPERRQMGERVRQGRSKTQISLTAENFDWERANATLPLIAQLLGIQ
ncbi:MAG: DUF5682 family protein [Cyanobacteria bacterium P01_F01_bin.150]